MKSFLCLLAALCALLAAPASAADEVKAQLFARVEGSTLRVALELDVAKGWHVYSGPTERDAGEEGSFVGPTKLEVTGLEATFGPWRFPKPEVEIQDFGTPAKTFVHRGKVVIYRKGKLGPGAKVDAMRVAAKGQVCSEDESGVCIPFDFALEPRTSGGDALFAAFPADLTDVEPAKPDDTATAGAAKPVAPSNGTPAQASAPPVAEETEEAGAETSLTAFLLSAVFWGLVTLLMPCTYPMIPLTITYFTKQADKRHTSTLPLSLCYGAGIVLIFVVIGLFLGPFITRFATHPITNIVMGVAFVYFALVLFGLFNLQPPAFLLGLAGTASQKGGYLGVFLMGATLVVTSFTCTAPFVGTLLSTAGASGDLGRVALGMGVFGLTMAVPFVFLSLVPGKVKAIPKSGEWMHALKVYLGFIELAASLKFFSNAEFTWQLHLLPRELFLGLWLAIFLAAAAYLFGWIRLRDEVGQEDPATVTPRRMFAGLANLCFAAYCLFGMNGNRLDPILAAFVPPYSNRIEGVGTSSASARGPIIIKDDYDRAVATAVREKKKLLVNFTGFN